MRQVHDSLDIVEQTLTTQQVNRWLITACTCIMITRTVLVQETMDKIQIWGNLKNSILVSIFKRGMVHVYNKTVAF